MPREQTAVPPADFRSYYGRPILKPPAWNWMIAAYLFLGGLSAGSALLGAGADLRGFTRLRRVSRLGALASILASLYFMIADLGRPDRFHHMLRVAKPSSPMSMGTWILSAYGPGVNNRIDSKIKAYNYFDLAGTWTVRDGTTLRFGVNNVFDKDPPIVDTNNFGVSSPPFGNGNTFPGVYDSLGRTFFVGITADF